MGWGGNTNRKEHLGMFQTRVKTASPPPFTHFFNSGSLLPSSLPLILLPSTYNWVYPSGFFVPISPPPAVLEEPFTAASAESVTLPFLTFCYSHARTHTHTFTCLSLSFTHTHKDSPQSSCVHSLCSLQFSGPHLLLHTAFSPTPPPPPPPPL